VSAPDAAAAEVAQQHDDSGSTRPAGRSLEGEKAQRIIDAMRSSVARRGSTGSTFDHVSREAGVSRGLLHYYFGTKEQLLAETVRRDCELRLERLEGQLSTAQTSDDFISLMAQTLGETISQDPDFITLIFELFTLSRRNPEIAAEYEDLLAAAERDGVLTLHEEPDAVAEILFSLGDGMALRMLSEPDRDYTATMRAAVKCARALLSD